MLRRTALILLVLGIVVGVAGLVRLHTRGQGTVPVGSLLEEREETGPCQAGRWPVKTLTDPAAGSIVRTPVTSSVASLGSLPTPGVDDATPRLASERQVVTVRASLYADHLEPDLDFHLVLHDPSTPSATMISEFPSSACTHAASSADRAAMAAARASYVRACGAADTKAGDYYVSGTALVTGVRLFDTVERQFGRAPNAVEIHPVLGFRILGSCAKYGGPRTLMLRSSIDEQATLQGSVDWTVSPTNVAAASIRSVAFSIDERRVATSTSSPFTVPGGIDTSTLVDGTHSFQATATAGDGSSSLLTVHAQTENGVVPAAPAQTLRIKPTKVVRGATVTGRAAGFVPARPVTFQLRRGSGAALRTLRADASPTGGALARLTVPATWAPGGYVVRACQLGCQLRATASLAVTRRR